MPVQTRFPPNASLDHLKHQAKDLIKAHAARDPQVAQRIREFHPRFSRATDAAIFNNPLRLSDAQLTIARERGFASWPRLKRRIEKPTLADNLSLPSMSALKTRHSVAPWTCSTQATRKGLRASPGKSHP